MNKIMDIDVIEDFKLEITFLNGVKGVLNLKRYNNDKIFRDASKFKNFGLMKNGDLEWSGGFRITHEEVQSKIILL